MDLHTVLLTRIVRILVYLGLLPITEEEYRAMNNDKTIMFIEAFGVLP